jgi:mycothiol synthase
MNMERGLPQLRMIHHLRSLPAPVALPDGYRVRLAVPEDAPSIARVLTESFEEPWDVDRVQDVLLANAEVPKTFVVDWEGEPVATASYQVMPDRFPHTGWLHYVGADPVHRGKRLGYAVSFAVMQEAVICRRSDIRLTTDDWRVPAIRVYLELGFEPDSWHETHSGRWAEVLKLL